MTKLTEVEILKLQIKELQEEILNLREAIKIAIDRAVIQNDNYISRPLIHALRDEEQWIEDLKFRILSLEKQDNTLKNRHIKSKRK